MKRKLFIQIALYAVLLFAVLGVTFYLLKFLAHTPGLNPGTSPILLKDFPANQQTTDYTCGPISALMVLEYFGDSTETETSLAGKMHCHVDGTRHDAPVGSAVRFTDYGTSIQEMHAFFASRTDFRIVDSSLQNQHDSIAFSTSLPPHYVGNLPPRFRDYADAAVFFRSHLSQGHPVLVCWNAWGGHWGVVIGLDDNGTADTAEDDWLTLADPYDTFDHQPDSRVCVPLALFFHDWYCTMTPKPYQLQPFLVVDRNQ